MRSLADVVASNTFGSLKLTVVHEPGETPLHWAARMGSIDIVKVLLEAGANPNVHGTTGTPLEVTPANETSIRNLLQRAIQALQPQPHVPVHHHAQHEVSSADMLVLHGV
jgi:ankyrin repeat protein